MGGDRRDMEGLGRWEKGSLERVRGVRAGQEDLRVLRGVSGLWGDLGNQGS